jgi:hypothetical protein
MASETLDGILSRVQTLPLEDQAILATVIEKRRIEAWRKETASEAKRSRKLLRAGKLKSLPIDRALAELESIAKEEIKKTGGS